MASGESWQETTCPICLECFSDPVTTECGHNFCRACLLQSFGRCQGRASCPLCREPLQRREFRPNQQLANLIQLVQKLQGGENPHQNQRGMRMCGKHQEPLKLFCQDHQTPICMVCDRSKEHREHGVIPIDEAAEEYKKRIQKQQQSMEEKSAQIMLQTYNEKQRVSKCLGVLKEVKKTSLFAFEQMQKTLETTRSSWLVLLDDLEKEIGKRQEDSSAKLSHQSTNVTNLIQEMARKLKQPGDEFLQDIRSISSRYETAQAWQMADIFPGLDKTLNMWAQKNTALEKAAKTLEESLEEALQKAVVTLDSNTAHPCLSLYLRTVSVGAMMHNLPDNPERFNTKFCVLGCERFITGRHWWVVEVEGESAEWAVGVAKESVRRKGDINLNPDEGIWAVGQIYYGDGYSRKLELISFTSPEPTILHSENKCRKIRVSLDYKGGYVTFSNADTGKLLFTFSSSSFGGERLYPFFEIKSTGFYSNFRMKLQD